MNLTKKQALLILLSTLFFVVASSSIYLLTPYPEDTLQVATNSEQDNKEASSITKNSSIKTSNNVVIDNIKLLNKDSSLSATITIPSDDIYLTSEQLFSKINNPKISEPKIMILDNSIKVSFKYKLIGNFDTLVSCNLIIDVIENKLQLTLTNASIGKIHLNDHLLEFIIDKFLKEANSTLEFSNSTISYDISKFNPSLEINKLIFNKENTLIQLTYNLKDNKK